MRWRSASTKRGAASSSILRECPILVPELARLMPRLRRHLARRAARQRDRRAARDGDRHRDRPLVVSEAQARSRSVDGAFGDRAALKLARLSWNGEDVAIAEAPSLRVGRFTVALPPGAFLQPTKEGERMLQQLVRRRRGGRARRRRSLLPAAARSRWRSPRRHAVHAVDSVAPQIDALLAAARQGRARVTGETRDLFPPAAARSRARAVRCGGARSAAARRRRAGEGARASRACRRCSTCPATPRASPATPGILADGGYRLDARRARSTSSSGRPMSSCSPQFSR